MPTVALPVTDLPAADRALRKATLWISRRLDGIGPGQHRSLRLGEGVELADIREYVPGDDVRSIDWNVTARTGHPHVRVYEADRETSALVVADRSASMAFGTAGRTKEGLLRELIAALSVLILRRGDRLGGLLFADRRLQGVRMSSGRRAALRLLHAVAETLPEEGSPSRMDLALEEADRIARRRSLIVVVSDLIDAGDWAMPLRRLATRHEVIVAEIRDPREDALPDVGLLVLEDPETGRQIEVDTTRAKVREAFAAAAEAQRLRVAQEIAASGAAHLIVSTDRDWLADLLRFLERRRRRRR
ncbi:MAG TPA: DUF58 domain-containing protein [Actinomycetota bacterium]|nr:DUF58 domain-containing protein [Actinomycetota bacterium]